MVEQVEGEIQTIKKDRKALTIENVWYNSFTEINKEFNKGDYVKISFGQKGDFNNIKSLVKVQKEPDKVVKAYEFNKEKYNNEPVKPKYISDTTINCLVMQSVEVMKNKNCTLDSATDSVINSYKKIMSL